MRFDDGTFTSLDGGVDVVACFCNGLDIHVHGHHLRAVHGAHVCNFARKVEVQLVVNDAVEVDKPAFVVPEYGFDVGLLRIPVNFNGCIERQEWPVLSDMSLECKVVL